MSACQAAPMVVRAGVRFDGSTPGRPEGGRGWSHGTEPANTGGCGTGRAGRVRR
ncbi:hypothetical protein ATKI12_7851 [Kitasatospora sp. Ki12]